MIYLLLALVAGGLLVGFFTWIGNRNSQGDEECIVVKKGDCTTCNGENSKCEQECMLEASVKDIGYYNDEELDAFAGRPADAYSEREVEQFSEVLYTMKPEEVKGWTRSLTLRGINIPNQLKDEVFAFL